MSGRGVLVAVVFLALLVASAAGALVGYVYRSLTWRPHPVTVVVERIRVERPFDGEEAWPLPSAGLPLDWDRDRLFRPEVRL